MKSPAGAEEFFIYNSMATCSRPKANHIVSHGCQLPITRDSSCPTASYLTARGFGFRIAPCSCQTTDATIKTDQNTSHSKQPGQWSSPVGDFMKDTSESLLEDAGALRNYVLSAKMVTCIGYWNVRMPLQSSKLSQIIKEMET